MQQLHYLNEDVTMTLDQLHLAQYFDALRAPVVIPFESAGLLKLLWSETQVLKTRASYSENFPQCPVADDIYVTPRLDCQVAGQ